jgi:hypothetical protein
MGTDDSGSRRESRPKRARWRSLRKPKASLPTAAPATDPQSRPPTLLELIRDILTTWGMTFRTAFLFTVVGLVASAINRDLIAVLPMRMWVTGHMG